MKTLYYKNIPIAYGELTIVKNENAQTIMKHSCKLARTIQTTGSGVLVVNTGLSQIKFMEEARTVGVDWLSKRSTSIEEKTPIIFQTSHRGELNSEMEEIIATIIKCNIRVLIITSWEWCASSWRRKEKLMYALRDLMATREIAVIVYSQGQTDTTIGCIDRGGVGKLATMANEVIKIETASVLEEYVPQEKTFIGTMEEKELFDESAQLLRNEINKIEGVILSSDKKSREDGPGYSEDDFDMVLAA